MKLSERQQIFAANVAKLIAFAIQSGLGVTLGEAYRTYDQQVLYYNGLTFDAKGKLVKSKKLSKTMQSAHLERLAIELNVFVKGVYQKDKGPYKTLGDYWKTLHPDNVWGGDWGWDAPHFEMKRK